MQRHLKNVKEVLTAVKEVRDEAKEIIEDRGPFSAHEVMGRLALLHRCLVGEVEKLVEELENAA